MRHALALALALLGAGALAGGAGAPMPMHHAGHAMPMTMPMMSMNDMIVGELRPLSGKAFDIRWTQLMIGHHQMALNMAHTVLMHGSDPRVKANAQQVIAAQQKEINQMTGWLTTWGAGVPMAMNHDMGSSTKGSADRVFVVDMIPHHQGAIDMAKLAPARTKNAELLKLAANIITAQQAEINQYHAWLKDLK